MKAPQPVTHFNLWRSESLFNIDFAAYTLSHHSFPRHFHDHYVIELVIKGEDHFYCDGKEYVAGTDQLVLINPGEVHTGSTGNDQPLHYFSFYPDRQVLAAVADSLHIPLSRDHCFTTTIENRSATTEKIRALYRSLVTGDDMLRQQELLAEAMQALLERAPADVPSQKESNDPRVQKVIDYICTQQSEDISLHQMAALVSLNPFHLLRLFKKTTGITPYDYLQIIRAERAKKLLKKGYPVQEAAIASGFYDASHLNRSFRKIAGTSPKSFLSSKGQYRTILNR